MDLPDRFVIESEIARGGMGIVYSAHHRISNQKLAVKVLKEEVARDTVNLRRFKQEATAIAKLNHANIIRLVDFGVTDSGLAYMVTELIEGKSLKERLHQGPLDLTEFYRLMMQVCDALAIAHANGIIHRDIKPSNILLNESDGMARVSDFGIARMSGEEKKDYTLTGTGEIIGSPYYMSPEQATVRTCDQRTDIYSLGCVMFEALIGATPFDGSNTIEVILNHVNAPVPSLSGRGFPEALTQIIERSLAKNPADRYPDVSSLRHDLAQAQSNPRHFKLSATQRARQSVWYRRVAISLACILIIVGLNRTAHLLNSLPYETKRLQAHKLRGNGKYEPASIAFAEAAETAQKKNAPAWVVADLYTWASSCSSSAGNTERALSMLKNAANTAQSNGNDDRKWRLCEDIAAREFERRQFAEAARYFAMAVDDLRQHEHRKAELCGALYYEALCDIKLNRLSEGTALLKESANMRTQTDSGAALQAQAALDKLTKLR